MFVVIIHNSFIMRSLLIRLKSGEKAESNGLLADRRLTEHSAALCVHYHTPDSPVDILTRAELHRVLRCCLLRRSPVELRAMVVISPLSVPG